MSDLDALLTHLHSEADKLTGDLWWGYTRAINDIREWADHE